MLHCVIVIWSYEAFRPLHYISVNKSQTFGTVVWFVISKQDCWFGDPPKLADSRLESYSYDNSMVDWRSLLGHYKVRGRIKAPNVTPINKGTCYGLFTLTMEIREGGTLTLLLLRSCSKYKHGPGCNRWKCEDIEKKIFFLTSDQSAFSSALAQHIIKLNEHKNWTLAYMLQPAISDPKELKCLKSCF